MGKKKKLTKPPWLDTAALVIAALSFVVAALALGFSAWTYLQNDRPHTVFEETRAKLDLLDGRIEVAEADIRLWREEPNPTFDLAGCEDNLIQARFLRGQAESRLMRNECDQAQEYILQADDLVATVPSYPVTPSFQAYWWAVTALVGVAILGGLLLLHRAITVRKGESGGPGDNQDSQIP